MSNHTLQVYLEWNCEKFKIFLILFKTSDKTLEVYQEVSEKNEWQQQQQQQQQTTTK